MLAQRRFLLSTQKWICSKKLPTFSRSSLSSESTERGEEEQEAGVDESIKKLNETISDLTEKYQRSLAETENVRMRLRKEIGDAKVYGIQSFCKDLLTVADVMRMAVASIPDSSVTSESDAMWRSFYEGVCMTDKELHKVFEKHGLVALQPSKGDKFDPNLHEALFESPVEGLEPGVIAHVQRIGYKLKDRTLRPAQVGISAKS